MINLILLFLVFNLSFEINATSATNVAEFPLPSNKSITLPINAVIKPSVLKSSRLNHLEKKLLIAQKPIKHNLITTNSIKNPSPVPVNKNKLNSSQKNQQKIIQSNLEKKTEINNLESQSLQHPTVQQNTTSIIQCKHCNNTLNAAPAKTIPRKKVGLVFMSKGGGGHISVSNALKNYLDEYEIVIANFFEDVMPSIDTIRSLTFGKASGEDIYNFCLQNRFVSLANGFTRLGAWTLRQRSAQIEPLLFDFVIKQKPDFIVSVIPVVNFAILEVAKKLNIPFIVVTNDLDTTNYINGISKICYNKFYYTISFSDRDIYRKFRSAHIPKKQVTVTGFPLRPEFYESNKNKSQIKRDFQIPENKQVVMVLMGGAGSFVCYRYVKTIMRMKKPMHIVACIGRDERLRGLITALPFPPHITISVVGFTNRVSDLMAVSDVLVTKAGPNSICEAMASNLPVLIDQTTGNIWWETLNVDFVIKNKIGDIVKRFKEVNNKITKFLEDAEYVKSIKARMAKIQAGIDFRHRIRCLIKRVVG